MNSFTESALCCNSILNDYPNNDDILFDKFCNLAMLSNFDEVLDLLERAILQGTKYKLKAKKSRSFGKLFKDSRFQKLTL